MIETIKTSTELLQQEITQNRNYNKEMRDQVLVGLTNEIDTYQQQHEEMLIENAQKQDFYENQLLKMKLDLEKRQRDAEDKRNAEIAQLREST